MTTARTTTPDVTVCILTWNQAQYIRQAIESIVHQVVDAKIEVLVGDDCSTDGTDTVIRAMEEEYPGVVRLIRHERQLGPSENYKRLLRLARGEFIAHLDGDDYWLPGKLQRQLDSLRENPGCSAAYANAWVIDTAGRTLGVFNDVPTQLVDLGFLIRRGNFLHMSSMIFRAELKHLLLEIEEPFIDYRVHLRFAREGLLSLIDAPLSVYRMNTATSMMASDRTGVRRMYWEAVMDVPRDLISDRDFAYAIANFCCQVIYRSIRAASIRLLLEWLPVIRTAFPYGDITMIMMISGEALRIMLRKLAGLFAAGVAGSGPNIINRR